MPLSLHQLTALDASPEELVRIAGELGVDAVCLFTHVPDAAAGRFPQVSADAIVGLRRALAAANMTLCNIEVFPLDRSGPRPDFAAGLSIGAALGASRATAHLHEVTGEQEAVDRFGEFADQAAAEGIAAGLEFNNFSAVRDLASAARIVRAAGRGSLVLDMLHAVRGGSNGEDVKRAGDLITYVQLSDGPAVLDPGDRWREAVGERLLPGEGEFPLADLARPLHSEVIYEVEVPQSGARKAGVSALERARRAVMASRRFLEELEKERER